MTQPLELNKMQLSAMTMDEMQEVNGGSDFWKWLAEQVVENWDDIKKGAKNGWNSVSYNK